MFGGRIVGSLECWIVGMFFKIEYYYKFNTRNS